MTESNDGGDLSELGRAVVMDDLGLVRELVGAGHTLVWEPFPFDHSALHIAADHGRADILEVLLDAGGMAYLDSLGNGWTPLGMAARKGHREAVQCLLSRGADANARDANKLGDPPLSDAVRGGFSGIVDDLLASGADPSIPGWMNQTARDRANRRVKEHPDENSRHILSAIQRARKN
jgi:ankyrin repeat protein